MATQNETKFKSLILPHFDAGYNLARWLTGNDADASDVLQESCVKALRFVHSLQTENAKSWFLQIVRNTTYTFLRGRKTFAELEPELEDPGPTSEELAVRFQSNQWVSRKVGTTRLVLYERLGPGPAT